jgi:hypothetical protein
MHILDWLDGRGGDFASSLHALLPDGVTIDAAVGWRPLGRRDPSEADFIRPCAPILDDGTVATLRWWWIAVASGQARSANWDLACGARFEGGQRGLVLVEAKAHVSELTGESKGKQLRYVSPGSQRNHARIGSAIDEAKQALRAQGINAGISRDRA